MRETLTLDYPSYILALAMGAGKTILIGAICATEFAMALEYPDGPFVMMMWNSDGAGPNNIGLVLSHETGHIFWACDEYYNSSTNTGCLTCGICQPGGLQGPRTATNRNCDYPFGSCYIPRADCMMKYESYTLCGDTVSQIGW